MPNMAQQDKKQLRKMKRDLKRQGSKRVRRRLKQDLRDHPEDAHQADVDFGRFTSQPWNGQDQDATRRRDDQ